MHFTAISQNPNWNESIETLTVHARLVNCPLQVRFIKNVLNGLDIIPGSQLVSNDGHLSTADLDAVVEEDKKGLAK